MAGNCCNSGCASAAVRGRYRRILWIALLINGDVRGGDRRGVRAGSVSLLADSLDFFGDAANYGVSLFVLGMGVVMRAGRRWPRH